MRSMGGLKTTAGCSTYGVIILSFIVGIEKVVGVSYDYHAEGGDWGGACATSGVQSPIALESESCLSDRTEKITLDLYSQLSSGLLGTVSGLEIDNQAPVLHMTWSEWNNEAALAAFAQEYGMSYDEAEMLYMDAVGKPLQLHFHTPSENTINGEQFSAEMHIVRNLSSSHCASHSDATCLGVLGIVYRQATELTFNSSKSAFTRLMEEHVPMLENRTTHYLDESVTLDLSELLPGDTSRFYSYLGSLTTPPCTPGVDWVVFAEPKVMSVPTLSLIHQAVERSYGYWTDYRPVQPLNGREVICNDVTLSGCNDAPLSVLG